MSRRGVGAVIGRLVLFAVLWWALSEGEVSTWTYAAVIVPLAVVVSVVLWPPPPGGTSRRGPLRRGSSLVALVIWFLGRSFAGGLDVARRVVAPRGRLDPGFVRCAVRLPAGPARDALTTVISLMPGSLAVAVQEREVLIHVLDTRMPVAPAVEELQQRIARVADLDLA